MKRNLKLCQLIALTLLLTGCGAITEVSPPAGAAVSEEHDVSMTETAASETSEPMQDSPRRADEPIAFDDITDAQAIERLNSQRPNVDYIADYHAGTPQTFREAGNGYYYYESSMDEATVLETFDALTQDQLLLARWYVDDPEIKCIAYDFYAIKDNGDGTAELGWYCYLIDRDDHMFCMQPEWNQKRTITLSDAPSPVSDAKTFYDVELTFEKRELLIGRDDPQIVIRAVPDASCKPDSVQLIDADTGELVCDLLDDCNYAAHGDDIKGDGWYCNRWTAPTDFGTDSDVSEEKTFRFYAQFEEDGVLHRSEIVELTVMEQWTDKELDDRQKVDDATEELMKSDEWKQGNTDTRRKLAVSCLEKLADEGLVIRESIYAGDDMVSWSFPSGGSSGIRLKPFDPRMN